MMRRCLCLLCLALCALLPHAQQSDSATRQKVAVYVSGNDVDKSYGKVIGSKLVNAITRTKEYAAVERTADFLAALGAETDYQTSGEVRDNQIARLGQKFGVKYVVVADLSEVFDELFISVRMINVETALVDRSFDANAHVEDMKSLSDLAENAAKGLLSQGGVSLSPSRTPVVTNGSVKTFTVNGISFNMVPVAGGTYQMGSYDSEAESDERYVHNETVYDFMIGETEVTQELWLAVMGSNPSDFKGSKNPVEMVSWNMCRDFINRLNSLTGQNFRLPTEAEWEYAARGGNRSAHYKYSGSDNLNHVAWYDGNSGGTTHPVGLKAPNELGIYDMSGNVWEWCYDYYSSGYDQPRSSSGRVLRGGGWFSVPRNCRVSYRDYCTPSSAYSGNGLRLAL